MTHPGFTRRQMDPLDPRRKGSEGGDPQHRAALRIECPTCRAAAGAWCPMPGTTWALCSARIPGPQHAALIEAMAARLGELERTAGLVPVAPGA